jgi:hypothetical protein
MAEVETDDAVLHVEVDGDGEPVTVLAHGLTNTCRELAQLTPLVVGTKVRFCFRAHGHSGPAPSGHGAIPEPQGPATWEASSGAPYGIPRIALASRHRPP